MRQTFVKVTQQIWGYDATEYSKVRFTNEPEATAWTNNIQEKSYIFHLDTKFTERRIWKKERMEEIVTRSYGDRNSK